MSNFQISEVFKCEAIGANPLSRDGSSGKCAGSAEPWTLQASSYHHCAHFSSVFLYALTLI